MSRASTGALSLAVRLHLSLNTCNDRARSVKGKGDMLAYDADSASVIKLSNNYVLYLREVNK